MSMKEIKQDIIELNDILTELTVVNRMLARYVEDASDIRLRQLANNSLIQLSELVISNSDYLMKYLQKTYTKERDKEEFDQLMSQLEKKDDGKSNSN